MIFLVALLVSFFVYPRRDAVGPTAPLKIQVLSQTPIQTVHVESNSDGSTSFTFTVGDTLGNLTYSFDVELAVWSAQASACETPRSSSPGVTWRQAGPDSRYLKDSVLYRLSVEHGFNGFVFRLNCRGIPHRESNGLETYVTLPWFYQSGTAFTVYVYDNDATTQSIAWDGAQPSHHTEGVRWIYESSRAPIIAVGRDTRVANLDSVRIFAAGAGVGIAGGYLVAASEMTIQNLRRKRRAKTA